MILFSHRKKGDMWFANYTDIQISMIHFVREVISSANLWANLQNFPAPVDILPILFSKYSFWI